jgi:hypothetical protein
MNYKVTKTDLQRLNRIAVRNNGCALNDAFFEQLRPDLNYVLSSGGLPLERDWVRCFIHFANIPRPQPQDMQTALLDCRESDLEHLPACPTIRRKEVVI